MLVALDYEVKQFGEMGLDTHLAFCALKNYVLLSKVFGLG